MPTRNSEMSFNSYPIRFQPIFLEKIWGGRKLENILDKKLPQEGEYGESWEISAVPGSISKVVNGKYSGQSLEDLINSHPSELLGKNVLAEYGENFPLLIKFLDAQDDLSIQVHPDDTLAKARHNSRGKSEMWYIISSEENAKLNHGFEDGISSEDYEKALQNDTLEGILHSAPVKTGDVFYIPAGTIHNIGKGILLAEIQQSSDVTYRIHDFNRKDKHGNTRELHLKESENALKFGGKEHFHAHASKGGDKVETIVQSPFFITKKYSLKNTEIINYPKGESFKVLIVCEGTGRIKGEFEDEEFKAGDTFLIPAELEKIEIQTTSPSIVLESQIP